MEKSAGCQRPDRERDISCQAWSMEPFHICGDRPVYDRLSALFPCRS